MPTFRITVVNRDFSTCTFSDFADIERARKQALDGALQIGSEEISAGSAFFGAEVSIADDERVLERMLVSIGQTPLRS